jgi:hypothetical protein
MMHAARLGALLLLAGCLTRRPAPPTGLMWGYFGESETIPNLRAVAYAVDRPSCEVNRARDKQSLPSWVGIQIPAECRQVVVGAGSDYWVAVITGRSNQIAVGTSDREWCVKMRESVRSSLSGWQIGECQPVAVKLMP